MFGIQRVSRIVMLGNCIFVSSLNDVTGLHVRFIYSTIDKMLYVIIKSQNSTNILTLYLSLLYNIHIHCIPMFWGTIIVDFTGKIVSTRSLVHEIIRILHVHGVKPIRVTVPLCKVITHARTINIVLWHCFHYKILFILSVPFSFVKVIILGNEW